MFLQTSSNISQPCICEADIDHSPPTQRAIIKLPTPQSTKSFGRIAAGAPGNVVSKYTFRWAWVDPRSQVPIAISFTLNTNVGVPAFQTVGDPGENKLEVSYNQALGEPNGFAEFDGAIGGGRIYFRIPRWDIMVSGPITGGPSEGATLAGSGSWIRN